MDRKQLLKMKAVKLGSIASNPKNPREDFQDQSLVESIKNNGLKDPIDVRPIHETDPFPDDILLVICDGDRRDDALKEIYPADHILTVGKEILIHDLTPDEAFDFNVIKNMEREDYNLREECNVVQHYKEQGLTNVEIAKKCNRHRSWVQDRLYVLKQDSEAQAQYFTGQLKIRDLYAKEKVSHVRQSEPSSLAGKLVQGGVVRETIAIEGPEDDSFDESVINPSGEIDKPMIYKVPRTKWLCLKDYEPIKGLILDQKDDGKSSDVIVKVPNQEAYTELTETIYGFIAYVGLDKDLKGVLKTYKNAVILKEFPETNGLSRIDVIWQDLADKNEFKLLLERSRKPKVKTHVDDRTTVLTESQFKALKKSDPKLSGKILSYQPIGDLAHVRWREYDDHMNAIKWLLENKDAYPLNEFQLKRYTPLTPEQISSVLATGQARKTFYLTTNLSLEELQEVLKNIAPGVVVDLHKDPNHYRFYYSDLDEREQITAYVQKENDRLKSMAKDPSVENLVWLDLSAEEFTVLPPRFSPIILREDKLDGGGTRLWFEDWPEQKKVEKYFSPAREFYNKKPIFPIDEDFIRLVHNNSHNMIEFSWKFFQKYYPELNRERIDAKNLWSDLNKNFTISLFERFKSKVEYMKIHIDNFKRALQWVSEYSKLEPNDQVLIAKPCKNCLRMTRLQLTQDLCGNCELSNSQQQKKAAAASKSGGAN